MKTTTKSLHPGRRGAALIIALIFITLFSTLALSLGAMCNHNAIIAANYVKGNRARICAESGQEVLRYWLSHVHMPGNVTPSERFNRLTDFLESDMAAAGLNVARVYDDDGKLTAINISSVIPGTSEEGSFYATITPTADIDVLQVETIGSWAGVHRDIRVNYNYGTRAHSVFDYGLATRGPLHIAGNIELTGVNVAVDSSVYIESENEDEALSIIGNSQIAGDVSITNPDAYVTLQGGKASIGGETGQEAIDNHVFTGIPPTEFPMPMPEYFEPYVQNIYDPNNVQASYDNVRIPAGTNPNFAADTTFRGVIFIEKPNIVTFSGHVTVTGIVVGDGEIEDDSATNRIEFLGTVDSYPVTQLPDEPQFAELREETGTFLIAPGFSVAFGGNFETINGAIAANGVSFFGDAGGTINGSIINYADVPMDLSGNSDLFFNRSGLTEVPSGFGPEIILHYIPGSYTEVAMCDL